MNNKIIFGLICGFACTGMFFVFCQFMKIPNQYVIWGGAFAGGVSISPVIFRYMAKLDTVFVKDN